eukprot:scaffold421275_cov58-Attheya_sp.AAC.1
MWHNKDVKKDIKVWMYLSLPINTLLLWGCESWTMTAQSIRILESFHTKSIRKILGIFMLNVEALRITNVMVRRELNSITTMENMIKKRQLILIGKLTRLPENRLPRQLLATWVQNPRKRSKPQFTLRNTMVKAIETIIPSAGMEATLLEWLPWAKDNAAWASLVANWWTTCYRDDEKPDPEPPPQIVHPNSKFLLPPTKKFQMDR